MKILIDTNVVLDIILERYPFLEQTEKLLGMADAIQENSARKEHINIIITRNEQDFKDSDLEIYTPKSFLSNKLQTN